MKRTCCATFCLLLWLVISTGLSAQAGAHSGDRLFPIPELTDEMLARIDLKDGFADEWYELIGEPTLTLLDFHDPYSNLLPDPSDLDFRIWLAWHDDPDRLYVAFVSSDDSYLNTHDYDAGPRDIRRRPASHDSIILTIDGDHSGGEGYGSFTPLEEAERIAGETQLYQAIARTASGPSLYDEAVHYQTGDFGWTIFPPYGDGGGGVSGETPFISVIELYVSPYDHWEGWHGQPEETTFSDLAAGQVVGFAFLVSDWDEDEDWRLSLMPESMQTDDPYRDISFRRADSYLDGLLLPADPTQPESAVESVTWGRIKAALNLE